MYMSQLRLEFLAFYKSNCVFQKLLIIGVLVKISRESWLGGPTAEIKPKQEMSNDTYAPTDLDL